MGRLGNGEVEVTVVLAELDAIPFCRRLSRTDRQRHDQVCLLLRSALRSKAGSLTFKRFPQLESLTDRLGRGGCNFDTAGMKFDQADGIEKDERFPNGRSADAQPIAEFLRADRFTGTEHPCYDRVPYQIACLAR